MWRIHREDVAQLAAVAPAEAQLATPDYSTLDGRRPSAIRFMPAKADGLDRNIRVGSQGDIVLGPRPFLFHGESTPLISAWSRLNHRRGRDAEERGGAFGER
jgi:hypothetical protein